MAALDTQTIATLMDAGFNHRACVFLGVYSRDQCPTHPPSRTRNYSAIINTDVSTGPGEHWVAIYFDATKGTEFFDSYGMPPRAYDIALPQLTRYNTHLLQSLDGTVCGQYCIHFLIHRALGYPLPRYVTQFSSDLRANDWIVHRFILDTFAPTPIHSPTRGCQCCVSRSAAQRA